MTVEIRRGSTRFVDRDEGRVTHHAFSFGRHYDPEQLGFGPMVCHDDHLLGSGRGFETHRHADLEIVSWVVSGALRHTDSSGPEAVEHVVEPGTAAVLSARSGVEHSEVAVPGAGPTRFVQTWLTPAADGAPEGGDGGDDGGDEGGGDGGASYALNPVTLPPDELVPVAQPRTDSVLWVVRIAGGSTVELPIAERVHVYVASGALLRSSLAEPLAAGDAFLMTDEPAHTVAAGVPTELLVWTFYGRPAPVRVGAGGAFESVGPPAVLDTDAAHERIAAVPPTGPLRVRGDYGGAFLWDGRQREIGADFDYLHRHLGLSRALYDDLAEWGRDWDGQDGTPEHDARGRELRLRLQAECPAYEFALTL